MGKEYKNGGPLNWNARIKWHTQPDGRVRLVFEEPDKPKRSEMFPNAEDAQLVWNHFKQRFPYLKPNAR